MLGGFASHFYYVVGLPSHFPLLLEPQLHQLLGITQVPTPEREARGEPRALPFQHRRQLGLLHEACLCQASPPAARATTRGMDWALHSATVPLSPGQRPDTAFSLQETQY